MKKKSSFNVNNSGWALAGTVTAIIIVTFAIEIISVLEGLIGGGFENLNNNVSNQNYDTLSEWLSLIAPQKVFIYFAFFFARRYEIDYTQAFKFNLKLPVIIVIACAVIVFSSIYFVETVHYFTYSAIPGLNDMAEKLSSTFAFNEPWKMALGTIIIGFAPAIGEELIFRGVVLNGLAYKNKILAIFGSAFFFALMHANPVQFLYPFFIGIIMAYMDIVANSILPSMIIHCINNTFSMFQSYFSFSINANFAMMITMGIIGLLLLAATLVFVFYYYMRMLEKSGIVFEKGLENILSKMYCDYCLFRTSKNKSDLTLIVSESADIEIKKENGEKISENGENTQKDKIIQNADDIDSIIEMERRKKANRFFGYYIATGILVLEFIYVTVMLVI